MTNPHAFERMRCTAVLLSCTPTISARLVRDGVVVLEVMRPPHPVSEHTIVPPCWFRAFLADWLANGMPAGDVEQRRAAQLMTCGIELGVRGGTRLLGGNVLRADAGDSWMHLHAVATPVETVELARRATGQEHDGVEDEPPIDVHAAHDLEVTVLGLVSARSEVASERAADRLRSLSMRVAIERLERELHAMTDHPARRAHDAAVVRRRDH